MEFIQSSHPDYEEMYYSDDGKLFLAKYRVMFGYRIRIGFKENVEVCSEIDICCGALEKHYLDMKQKLMEIMCAQPEHPLLGIPPYSHIKPYFNDEAFCDYIDYLHEKLTDGRST